MTWSERCRARKVRRLEDRLDDAESWLWKWGFALPPSERRKRRERIEALKSRLAGYLDTEGSEK